MERSNCGRDEDVDDAEDEINYIGEIPSVVSVFSAALHLELEALIDSWISDTDSHAQKKVSFLLCANSLDVNANNVSKEHRHIKNVKATCCSMMPVAKSLPFEIHEIQNGLTAKQVQF
jgi:hypothetical protein